MVRESRKPCRRSASPSSSVFSAQTEHVWIKRPNARGGMAFVVPGFPRNLEMRR